MTPSMDETGAGIVRDIETEKCIFCGSANLWRYGAENPLKCEDCGKYQQTSGLPDVGTQHGPMEAFAIELPNVRTASDVPIVGAIDRAEVIRFAREQDAAIAAKDARIAELEKERISDGVEMHDRSCRPWGAPGFIRDCPALRCKKIAAMIVASGQPVEEPAQ